MKELSELYNSLRNVFWRICKRGSTEEFESIPYVSKLLNAYFWIYYGLIKPDSLLVATVNMFGAVVEIIFLTIFLLFAPPRMKVNLSSSSCFCLNPFNLLFQVWFKFFFFLVFFFCFVSIHSIFFSKCDLIFYLLPSNYCFNNILLLWCQIRTAILVVVLDVVFPAAAILCTHFLLHGDTRIDVAGLLCVAFSMVAYASPLSAMVGKKKKKREKILYMQFFSCKTA